jgi:hypothetical protein
VLQFLRWQHQRLQAIAGYTGWPCGGSISSDQSIDLIDKQEEKKMCRLPLALMQRMGMKAQNFGDANAPVEEIA